MKFSWLAFLREHHLEFVSEGAHSAKGNVHIKCPWCGEEDRSEHMGLSLNERQPYYACWRNAAHRGRNPARLVATLLGCSWEEAQSVVARDDTSAIDLYEAAVTRILTPPLLSASKETSSLPMPDDFYPLATPRPGRGKFLDYLVSRGFDEVERLAEYYDLRYCRFGYFAQRIIVPIFHERQLVAWTGRAIGAAVRRYINLSEDADTARKQGFVSPAVLGMGSVVFNYDRAAEGGRTLIICEGPFDALKLDWFAPEGDTAVAVFGMPKQAQVSLLLRLAKKFERTRVALDAAALSNSLRLWWNELGILGNAVRWLDMPPGVKDPGAMDGAAVAEFLDHA